MDWITEQLGISSGTQGKILASFLVVLGIMLVRALVIRALRNRFEDLTVEYQARKIATYVATFAVIVSLAFIWIDAFDDMATFLGLLSAGIAIALADVLRNMAGWMFVLARRPFRIGDRIEIAGHRGDVVDIRLFRFSVMEVGEWVDADQSTGRLLHIPNGMVFTSPLMNYTEGFAYIWHEIPVLVTFESDWREAERLIFEALREHGPDVETSAGSNLIETARRYHIRIGALTPTVYLTVKDSGVLLTARLLVESRQRRGVEHRIWRAILDAFDAHPDVELAYPTVRTFFDGPVRIEQAESPQDPPSSP